MSGSWDRPSRDPDGDWPAEDIEPPASPPRRQAPDDAWASGDLWPEPALDAPPGWDEWPAQSADDEYVVEEPPPPVLSDPWGESWSEESSMAPAPRDRWNEPEGDRSDAVEAGDAGAETFSQRATDADDAPIESAPSPAVPPASTPLRPWSPEVDPWDAHAEPGPEPEPELRSGAVEEPGAAPSTPQPGLEATHEAEVDAEPERVAEPSVPESGSASAQPPLAGAFRGLGRAARTVLPDWLAEPIGTRMSARQEPGVETAAGEAPRTEEAADEHSPDEAEPLGDSHAELHEAPPETGEVAAGPEQEAHERGEPIAEPAPDPAPAVSRPWWRSAGPWGSPSASDRKAAADTDTSRQPDDTSQPGPGPEARLEPPAEERAQAGDGKPATAADEQPAEPSWPAEPRDPWPTGPADATAAVVAAGVEDARPSDEQTETAEPPAPPGATGAAWDDPARPAVESTQVLPTSWAAPVPEARPTPDPGAPLAPVGGDIRTRLREPRDAGTDTDEGGEPEPTTAEQAVPWLIGFILLLAGMVIVLLALIFAGDESLGASGASPTASAVIGLVSGSASASPSATAEPSASPTATERAAPSERSAPTVAPTPTPLALPEYGPLEVIYQGRSAALAPIYLLHREFTVEGQPDVLAQDPTLDVRRFAWAPDGTVGVGLYADVLVSVEIGTEKRRLGDGLSTVTFGDDAETVYAVGVTQDGDDDVATVLAIDFASADTREVATVSYARPDVADAESLTEAQFADDGGPVRLYWMEGDVLMLWAIGGGAWEITPDEGEVTEIDDVAPVLWAPDRQSRIDVVDGAQSTLRLREGEDEVTAATMVGGLVSHLRWSPSGDRVVFTVARSAAGGGILQDLFLWDLADGAAPTQLTATGAAFGAEWRGSQPRWAFE